MRADRQTAGHGRLGRAWEMPAGNLAMSGLIRLQPGEGQAPELGFVAALALHDAVATLVDPALLQLKWPNDLLLDGAKLSGILLERTGDALVLGIGVNLAVAPDIAGRATVALADHGVALAAAALADMVVAAFSKRRFEWRRQGFAASRAAWLQRAHPLGTMLRVTAGAQLLEGGFAGLAEDGALLLQEVDGRRHVVHAGDVFALPQTGARTGEMA